MTPTKKADRTYGQYCPIARGLDVLGDRWTLLICRELFLGDQRFTDLRTALPGLAPNLLTERLRSLQRGGLVESVELPPPAARTVYRLTEAGSEVGPVLRAMSRFGAQYLDEDVPATFTARRAANTLLSAWRRGGGAPMRVRLELEEDRVDLVVTPGNVQVVDAAEPGADVSAADVVVRTTTGDLIRARQGERLVATLSGTAAARREFLDTFRLQLAR